MSPPSEKVGGHVPRDPYQIAPMTLGVSRHTFWLTAIRRGICAALYFCNCELRWRSTVFYSPVLTKPVATIKILGAKCVLRQDFRFYYMF